MVTLFIGLFTAAGVMPQRAKASPPKRSAQASGAAKAKPGLTNYQRAAVRALGGQHQPQNQIRSPAFTGSLPPAIAGLLATLPPDGGYWTKERRDGFIATFEAVIDYTFKIGEPPIEQETADTEPTVS
jgi:hypothetical protein